MLDEVREALRGVVAVTVTPLDDGGRIDEPALAAVVERLHNVSVIKEALAQLGVCGRAVRPPMTELSGPDRQRVSDILRTLA